jgi:hypothetical protein
MSPSQVDILLKVNAETRDLIKAQTEMAKLRSQFLQMARMGVAFAGAQAGLQGLVGALRASVGAGIEFNRMVQNTTDSLRAMALAGEAAGDGARAAMLAAETMGVLRARANETGEALNTVVQVFQESAAVAQTNGISLRAWADVAVEATRAGANMGLSVERIRTQLAQLAIGDVRSTNILSRALGLDRETLQRAIEAGNLVDLLRERLAPYQTRVDGLEAAQNRLSNTLAELWGRVALPLFEQMEQASDRLSQRLDASGGRLRLFGEVMADVVRVAARLVSALITLGPAIAALTLGIAARRAAMLATALATVAANTDMATAAKTRLAAALRVLGLANPLTAMMTAITAIVGGLYLWNIRQRDLLRQVRETRAETERIRLGGRERIGQLTTEEARTTAVRDVTAQILDLERRITGEKALQRRATEAQIAELARQRDAMAALTPQDLRENARRLEADRRREADLVALPDRLAELRKREEERRLAALSADERVKALEARKGEIAAVLGGATLEGMEAALAALDRQAAAGPPQAFLAAAAAEVAPTGNFAVDAERQRQAAEAARQAWVATNEAERAALSARIEAANRLMEIEDELAEARRLHAEEVRAQAREAERAYQIQLDRITALVRKIDGDLADPAKIGDRVALEARRKALIEEADAAFEEYARKVGAFGLPEADLAALPDLGDAPAPMDAWDRIQADMGNLWQNMQDGIVSVADSLRSSIGGALEGLITRTMSWGDALRSIALSFGQSMLRAFADMVAQYAVSRTAMFVIEKAHAAKSLALSMANAAKNLIAWIPSALAASISSFGAAAAIGAAAVAAILAVSGGFAEGGYTGPGGKWQPAGIVHAGEWVAPASMVRDPDFGPVIAGLERHRRGYASGGPVAMPLPSSGATNAWGGGGDPRPLQFAFVDDRNDARRLQANPDFETIVVDIMKRHRGDFLA